jgi:hypothetical protein
MTDTTSRSLRIFLCHSSADKSAVRELYHRLRADGFAPWLDEEDLLPGQDWEREIPRAVRQSDIVIVCLSPQASNKEGYIQKEIKLALDAADEKPEGTIFLVPLKLEECNVPDRLNRWQWVNLFSPNGYERLIRALQSRAKSLKIDATLSTESLPTSTLKLNKADSDQQSDDVNINTAQVDADKNAIGRGRVVGVSIILILVIGLYMIGKAIISQDTLLGVSATQTAAAIAILPITPKATIVTLIATNTTIPTSTLTNTPTPASAIFPQPVITEIITGFEPAGYSKLASITTGSQGDLTLFIRNDAGDLGFTRSIDNGKTWSKPNIFDRLKGIMVSAAIDSADRVHVVWGHVPEAGDVKYGLLNNDQWVMTATVGTGAFARDIAVDSANHPHIVWTGIDLSHVSYDGQKWIGPQTVTGGAWHPDILINPNDDVLLFMNSGNFYPAPGVSVYEKDNIGGHWNSATKVSTSPFWSGGAAASLDSQGNIYLLWMGATTESGGTDQVFFSRYIDGGWQTPFPIGNVNTSAGSTGQESPAVEFDANDILYVFWRGLNDKNRPVIFARAYATENSKVSRVTTGWSPVIQIDDRNASGIGWPSVADMYYRNRAIGVDLVWGETVGKNSAIAYSHVQYP